MNKKDYIKKIKALGDTEKYVLEDLRKMTGYPGTLQCFRVLCWRYKVPFAKGYRRNTWKLAALINSGYDFPNSTLKQIKKDLDYDGGMYGLLGLLKRHNLEFKRMKFKLPIDLKKRILALGDTSELTPIEIFRRVGVEVQNPSQILMKFEIPYKSRNRTTN